MITVLCLYCSSYKMTTVWLLYYGDNSPKKLNIVNRAGRYISCDMHAHLVSKPVPWLAVNLHHLFSNGAAFIPRAVDHWQATQYRVHYRRWIAFDMIMLTWQMIQKTNIDIQESPRSDVFRKRDTKPLLNQRQRQKHLTWAKGEKELDCCSVVQSPLFRWK